MPDLRYAACRMCEMVANLDTENVKKGIGSRFSRALLTR
jgi:hypothetical protein